MLPTLAVAGDGAAAAVAAVRAVWPAAVLTPPEQDLACEGRVQADAPGLIRNGATQVRLRCEGRPSWVRYARVGVQQQGRIAVLRQPLARGAALTADHLEWKSADVMQEPADVMTAFAEGTARRELAAGTVLRASQFVAPAAIQRGQRVTLLSRAAGMEVRAPGEALADARLGGRVAVRNQHSRRVVEGIAGADGIVEVRL
jgi:flagella basal body P-ring formation protein FlgA